MKTSVPELAGYEPTVKSIFPKDPGVDTKVVYKKEEKPKVPQTPNEKPKTPEKPTLEVHKKENIKLPNTGEKEAETAALGMLVLLLAGVLKTKKNK